MAIVSQTCASLRIWGDDLIPEEITAMLGSNPSMARRKGEPMQTPPSHPPSRTGMWTLSTERASGDELDRQITWLLSQLTSDLTVWNELTDRFEMDMFCGVWIDEWNQGLCLSPPTTKLLGERHIPFVLDIYLEVPEIT